MKEQKGKFYKRVLLGLLWPVLIFILISITAISFLLIQLDESGNDARRIIFSKQKNMISSTFLSIQNTISELSNYTIDSWIDSNPDNFRYYYSTQLYRIIKKLGITLNQTPIDISLIVDFPSPMVMTASGSSDIDWYFDNYVNISEAQQDTIKDMLRSREYVITSLPVYNNDNELTDIYTVIPYDTDNNGRMLIVARVYITPILEIEEKEQAFIIFGDTIIPYWNTDTASTLINEHKEQILSYNFTPDNENSFLFILQNPWIQFVAFFSDSPSVMFWLTIAIIIALGLLAIGIVIVLLQTKHIYQPVSAAIATEDVKTGTFDEFEIIQQRSTLIKELSSELKTVLEERNQLARTRQYRFFLEGDLDDTDENDDTKYVVSLVQFSDIERGVDVQYFQLTLEEKGIIYVPYGFNRFAIIYEDMDAATARKELEQVLVEISNEATFNATLSDVHIGKQNLDKAYKQCLYLMDFTTSLRNYRIITPSDVSYQITDFYHYPAQSEAKLISLVVTGVPQAYNEYDRIVNENITDKTLSDKTKLEFAYCMVFTIQRIFSELNKSPQALIGRDINFSSMLREQSYSVLLDEIQDIMYKIIDSTHSMTSESDAQLLMMMKKYIHEKYMYDIGLQDLADCFNITPKYCGMLFSKLSNDTFKNYLNNYRIEEAKEIIHRDPSIKVSDLSLKVDSIVPRAS